jgi:hypothetical protein
MENEVKLKRALSLLAEIELRKKLYEELDALVLELRTDGFVSGVCDGLELELKDNFADTNTQWRMAAVKRYELKVTDPNKPKRTRKAAV